MRRATETVLGYDWFKAAFLDRTLDTARIANRMSLGVNGGLDEHAT
jgi:hypothetical protein